MIRRICTTLLLLVVAASGGAPSPALAADPLEGSVVLPDGRVLPPMPADLQQPSVHAEMLASEGAGEFAFAPGGPPAIVLRDGQPSVPGPGTVSGVDETQSGVAGAGEVSALPNGLRKEVFGFLPYWMLTDAALDSMNYNLVSTIAYFSVGATRDGNLVKGTSTGWTGWNSSAMTTVINRAHSRGVKVVLTVTMMAWDSTSAQNMATLLNSSSNRARLVTQIVDAVRQRGADGVNLDFEPVGSSLRAAYTAFVRQLKAGLVNGGVGRFLTVCTTGGAATWATGYDVAGLTASGAADALFVMGYDYHWSGSSRAGGVAPIDSPYVLDVSSSMADFLSQTSGSKLIWGVPYYGRTWQTTSKLLNAPVRSGGVSRAYYYTGNLSQANSYGRQWDPVGKVPWHAHWDAAAGSWVQGYYDDTASLGVKYDLVNARGLAGTGMWTLLMDQGRDELWRLLATKFVTDTEPPVGGVSLLPETTDASTTRVSWTVLDYQSGIDRYNVQVRRPGFPWVGWLTGTKATGAYFTGTPGYTYDFRVQGIDYKGNVQAWTNVPSTPSAVTPGAFAEVVPSTLNIRSGVGTGYPIVATASAGERLSVISGPSLSGGMDWYQVEYGFAEWPSSDYPKIGWAAAGSSTETYLVPAPAPSRTQFDPFVSTYAPQSGPFSPNGDGRRDGAVVAYALQAPATVQLEVVNAAGAVVRSVALGSRGAGSHAATWDGRLADGSWAGAGRYLLRLVATDGASVAHAAPTAAVAPEIFSRWGVTADLSGPTVTSISPAPGAGLQPASTVVSVRFSEAVGGLVPSSLGLYPAGSGTAVPAELTWNLTTLTARLEPQAPLAPDAPYEIRMTAALTDVAANPVAPATWSFRTAPGTVYADWRRMTVRAGTYRGYRLGAGGAILGTRTVAIGATSGASVSQRSTLPNLPGRWLFVENGAWDSLWLPESAAVFLPGTVEHDALPTSTRVTFRAGTHTGYRFATDGDVTATRSATLAGASGANTDARAAINGRWYLHIVNGIWAGYWVPESWAASIAGRVDEMSFPGAPRITFATGTYTGYAFDAAGRVTGSRTYRLTAPSGASASGWAVINGRPYFRVANGIWAGYWVQDGESVDLGT